MPNIELFIVVIGLSSLPLPLTLFLCPQVFQGEGISGTQLSATTVTVSTDNFQSRLRYANFSSPIAVTAGQMYTFQIVAGSDVYFAFYANNTYLGGSYSGAVSYDMGFEVWIGQSICQPFTVCDSATSVEYAAPTPTSDRVCGLHCVVSSWGSFGSCSKSCGSGTQTQSRSITTAQTYNGNPCPTLTNTQSCNTNACPVNCVVTSFGPFSSCSRTCGTGTQTQVRNVTTAAAFGGVACPSLTNTQTCNTQACPIDCVVADWGEIARLLC